MTAQRDEAQGVVAACDRLRLALRYATAALEDREPDEAALALRIAMRQSTRMLARRAAAAPGAARERARA